jgi:uncharacterized Zn finger protein (UPF0148 family)
MKIFCESCGHFATLEIMPLREIGDRITGDIVCTYCEATITTLEADDDEWEMDPEPEGYYTICKVKDYYPNGG